MLSVSLWAAHPQDLLRFSVRLHSPHSPLFTMHQPNILLQPLRPSLPSLCITLHGLPGLTRETSQARLPAPIGYSLSPLPVQRWTLNQLLSRQHQKAQLSPAYSWPTTVSMKPFPQSLCSHTSLATPTRICTRGRSSPAHATPSPPPLRQPTKDCSSQCISRSVFHFQGR